MIGKKILVLILFIILLQNSLWAQKIIHGTIRNMQTNEVLANANIQIMGTYRGTISNDDGKYILELKDLPATVSFRYIGYKTNEIIIDIDSPNVQNIYLHPVAIEMKPIVVTGEDPAVVIMREVIQRKMKWREKLKTYSADGYTRLVLENDSGIVSILESTSKVFWDNKNGSRELIYSKRSTSNLNTEQNFAAASYQPNFYDDDIQLQGAEFIGPTHPKALKYYNFHLENEKVIDDKTLFDISLTPKTRLNPAFVGNILVLDEEYALIDVKLKPSETFVFPTPIKKWDLSYEQQFSNFGKDFWLPVDVRIRGEIKIAMVGFEVPRIKYKQVSRMTDYSINCELPDSLYEDDKSMINDASNIQQDTLLSSTNHVIPLTEEEENAYSTLDSTMTLDRAFKPRGFLADLASVVVVSGEDTTELNNEKSSNTMFNRIKLQIRYNRVEGLHSGFKYIQPIFRKVRLNVEGGYKTGLKEWSHGTGFEYNFTQNISFKFSYQDDIFTQSVSDNYPSWLNSLNSLVGYNDYFNYYSKKSFNTSLEYTFEKFNGTVHLGFKREKHSSVEKTTDYNILGRNIVQTENPSINEGDLRAVNLTFKMGGDLIPWGILGSNRAAIAFQYSSADLLLSDFSYASCYLTVDSYFQTFYQRRILPNTLYFKLNAFLSSGNIPIQCIRSADVRMAGFTPFGVFKTLGSRTWKTGDYISFFWEHNFRTIPLEIIGLRGLAKTGMEFIIYGASGKFWRGQTRYLNEVHVPYLNNIQNELGISINKVFNFFRIDFTKNLNRKDYFIGISIARMF